MVFKEEDRLIDSPGWSVIFLIALVIMTACVRIGAIVSVSIKEWRKANPDPGRKLAQHICEFQQCVTKIEVYPPPGMLVLEIRALSDEMEEARLYFSRRHPDFPELEALSRMDRVWFDVRAEPVKGIPKDDAVAHLRLRR